MHMDISREKVIPTRYPLMGFVEEQVFLVGFIELPVIAGAEIEDYNGQIPIDRPSSAYKANLGRTALNELKAITSMLHLKMKFSTEHGVKEVKGD
jgi:hypothetical protein